LHPFNEMSLSLTTCRHGLSNDILWHHHPLLVWVTMVTLTIYITFSKLISTDEMSASPNISVISWLSSALFSLLTSVLDPETQHTN
jgi:hypothetical protein